MVGHRRKSDEQFARIVIAYEPAIGAGNSWTIRIERCSSERRTSVAIMQRKPNRAQDAIDCIVSSASHLIIHWSVYDGSGQETRAILKRLHGRSYSGLLYSRRSVGREYLTVLSDLLKSPS